MKNINKEKTLINKPYHFGRKLKEYLKSNQIAAKDFSKDMGLHQEYAYQLFKRSIFSMEMTLKICDEYSLPITFFIEIEEKYDFFKKNNVEDIGIERLLEQIDELKEKVNLLLEEKTELQSKIIELQTQIINNV